jgi:glycosyltransferase involved in cell wall biosynthesis
VVFVADSALMFSVVVPTRGGPGKLGLLLDALDGQSLPRDRFEVVLAFDGVEIPGEIVPRLARSGVRVVRLPVRSGPGVARNRGAAEAHGEFLAFTEDDVTPSADWLERAAERLGADPALDVLEGTTVKPGDRPVRVLGERGPSWLPTNLFVRRTLFRRVGGYHDGFFNLEQAIYFREDSDFGFTLEEAGARIGLAPEAKVTHPDEHPGWLDPLRWARRYEMDALLARRHPRQFRQRIEVHRLGPLRIRRPIVRSAWVCVLATFGALMAPLLGGRRLTMPLLILAAIALLPIWGKWRFHPARLPVTLIVPFVLVGALVRGRLRVMTGVVR